MGRLDDIYKIVGAYGLGRVLPQGSTRAAAKAAIDGIIRSGKIIVPAAARAAPAAGRVALNVARANPYASAALLGYGAYEAGLLDPVIERIPGAGAEEAAEQVIDLRRPRRRRRSSGFNKGISAGMAAVRGSKWMGKKGTISNPKRAFGTVTKTVSAMKKGRKAPKSGIRKLIYRAAKRFL